MQLKRVNFISLLQRGQNQGKKEKRLIELIPTEARNTNVGIRLVESVDDYRDYNHGLKEENQANNASGANKLENPQRKLKQRNGYMGKEVWKFLHGKYRGR